MAGVALARHRLDGVLYAIKVGDVRDVILNTP